MADETREPLPLDYAGRTPHASQRMLDERQRSILEGCGAGMIIFGVAGLLALACLVWVVVSVIGPLLGW